MGRSEFEGQTLDHRTRLQIEIEQLQGDVLAFKFNLTMAEIDVLDGESRSEIAAAGIYFQ